MTNASTVAHAVRRGGRPSGSAGLTVPVLFAFLVPSFIGYVGSIGAAAVNGGLAALIAVVLLSQSLRVRFVTTAERRWSLFLLGVLTYYLAAICLSTAFLSERVIVRDLFELHKPLLYTLSVLLPFAVIRTERDVSVFERVLFVAFAGIVAASVLQLLAPPAFGALYTKNTNVRMGRVTAPFGNPYDFGIGVSFFLYYFTVRYLRLRDRRAALLAALALVLCALTQSRTAAITIIFSLAISLPLVLMLADGRALSRLRVPVSIARFLVIGAVAVGLAALLLRSYADELAYLLHGLTSLIVERQQASLDVRLAQIGAAWEQAAARPLVALFGNGVSKASMEFVESTPAFYFYRYGAFGLAILFLAPLVAIVSLATARVARGDSDHLDQAILVWLLSLFVASIGNAFTEQPRISFLYYFVLGLVVRRHFLRLAPPRRVGPGARSG